MKAKLPERQSKGVNGPPITESSYKRYTARKMGKLKAQFQLHSDELRVRSEWFKADRSR